MREIILALFNFWFFGALNIVVAVAVVELLQKLGQEKLPLFEYVAGMVLWPLVLVIIGAVSIKDAIDYFRTKRMVDKIDMDEVIKSVKNNSVTDIDFHNNSKNKYKNKKEI